MRIFILGTGRMGAWLTEELCLDNEVTVFDSDPLKMKYFIKVRRLLNLSELDSVKPELFINCVTLGNTEAAFDAVLPHIPADCIISDISSVKTGLAAYYEKSGHPFVSSHPMFGPTFANIRDLENESAIIISESCEEGKDFFKKLYSNLGIHILEKSFEEHDRTVAYSLATPFASTIVFAACMKQQDAPGTTFKKHLAIAKGLFSEDDRLISEILFNPYTTRQLDLINSQLAYLVHIINDKDYEEMQKYLAKLRANIGVKK